MKLLLCPLRFLASLEFFKPRYFHFFHFSDENDFRSIFGSNMKSNLFGLNCWFSLCVLCFGIFVGFGCSFLCV